MIKTIHLFFITISLSGFFYRVYLLQFQPQSLQKKWLKITPHIIDTLVLSSGAALILQGQWLEAPHDWLYAKMLGLISYIGFGIIVMRSRPPIRWYAFAGAIACFIYIASVAVHKTSFI